MSQQTHPEGIPYVETLTLEGVKVSETREMEVKVCSASYQESMRDVIVIEVKDGDRWANIPLTHYAAKWLATLTMEVAEKNGLQDDEAKALLAPFERGERAGWIVGPNPPKVEEIAAIIDPEVLKQVPVRFWGWEIKNGRRMPIMELDRPASDEALEKVKEAFRRAEQIITLFGGQVL